MAHLLHRFETLVPARVPGLPPGDTKFAAPWEARWLEAIRAVACEGHALDVQTSEWDGALFLARLHGWRPRGVFRRQAPDERFDDYWSGEDYWVDDEDADALAEAWERALARRDLPAVAQTPPSESTLRESMPAEEAWALHQTLWALHLLAPENRPQLQAMVRFARRGAFQIG